MPRLPTSSGWSRNDAGSEPCFNFSPRFALLIRGPRPRFTGLIRGVPLGKGKGRAARGEIKTPVNNGQPDYNILVARFELEKLTWEDVEKLDRSKPIVFLPISPLEEHGPQLPVGTDFMAAREMAALAVETLEKQDPSLSYLIHPGIPLGCAGITADFAGTISVGGKSLMRVVYDTSASLGKHGFKYVVISNQHYDPEHVKAILTAGGKLWKRYRLKVADPLATAAFSSNHPENSSGLNLDREMHADMEETSLIKFRHPELLRELYKDLPSVHLKGLALRYAIGMNTLRKMGAARGYVGSPALATSEYGKEYFEARAKMIAETAIKMVRGEKLPEMSLGMKVVLRVVRLT